MGDLAKYIAEVIEFVVAGVLVLFSLLLLAFAIVHPDLGALPDTLPLVGVGGAAVPVLTIAVIYAIGILAEGMSRLIFERGLSTLTMRRLAAHLEEDEGTRAREEYVEMREEWRMAVMARSAPLGAQIEGQLKRLRVERASALSGYVATLALLIELVRHLGEPGWVARLVALLGLAIITACASWLSKERLKRYLGSIIRCYDALPPAEAGAP